MCNVQCAMCNVQCADVRRATCDVRRAAQFIRFRSERIPLLRCRASCGRLTFVTERRAAWQPLQTNRDRPPDLHGGSRTTIPLLPIRFSGRPALRDQFAVRVQTAPLSKRALLGKQAVPPAAVLLATDVLVGFRRVRELRLLRVPHQPLVGDAQRDVRKRHRFRERGDFFEAAL